MGRLDGSQRYNQWEAFPFLRALNQATDCIIERPQAAITSKSVLLHLNFHQVIDSAKGEPVRGFPTAVETVADPLS